MVSIATTSGSSPSATSWSRAADRYEFVTLLQHGRTGSTYQARDRMSERPVTIKLLAFRDPEAKRRFEHHAALLCRLDHPHIVPVLDYGYHFGLAYLVTEDRGGTSLQDYLQHRGPLQWEQFAAVFDAVVQALGAAHELDIVHGDIQPSHIILFDDGARVTNVGIAGFGFPDLHGNGIAAGDDTKHVSTVDAIAPEKLLQQACDHRLDLYELGETAYELLTASPAFESAALDHVFQRIYEPPIPLAGLLPEGHAVPTSVHELIGKLLAKSPSDRPQSAEQVSFWFRSAAGLDSYDLRDIEIPALGSREREVRERALDIEAARPRLGRSSSPSRSGPTAPLPHGELTASGPTVQLSNFTPAAPRPPEASLSPRLVFQLAALLSLFITFAAVGWIGVMHLLPSEPEQTSAPPTHEPSPAPPPFEETSPKDEYQSVLSQIDDALDDRRYGTAEGLIHGLEQTDEFPSELRGTLKGYRSRLELASKLDRARRLESSGQREEALLLYSDVAKRYPEHVQVPEDVEQLQHAFVLEVNANVRSVVFVDDEPVGVTPFTGLVPASSTKVSVSRKGYRTWESAIAAQKGTKLELDVKLKHRGRHDKPDKVEIDLQASPFMDLMEMDLP